MTIDDMARRRWAFPSGAFLGKLGFSATSVKATVLLTSRP